MGLRRYRKPCFELGIAAAEQHQPAAETDEPRQRGEQQVEALLRGQPGDGTEERRGGLSRQAEALLQGCFRRRFSGSGIVDAIAARQQRIVVRRPDFGIDAVQDAGQHIGSGAQQPIETPAEGRGLDLARIGRADRRQPVGIKQSGLEERQAAVELHPVDRKKAGRQREVGKEGGREIALIGQIVHGEDARQCGGVGAQIGRRQPGMPIVAMQDLGQPPRVGALRQRRRDPAEEREAAMVVGPVVAVGRAIGAARPVVEGGVIDDVGGDPALRHQRSRDAHPLDCKGRAQPERLAKLEGVEKPGKPRQHQSHIGARFDQGRRQCRHDVAETAGLDPREQLGGGMQDTQRHPRRDEPLTLPLARVPPSPRPAGRGPG